MVLVNLLLQPTTNQNYCSRASPRTIIQKGLLAEGAAGAAAAGGSSSFTVLSVGRDIISRGGAGALYTGLGMKAVSDLIQQQTTLPQLSLTQRLLNSVSLSSGRCTWAEEEHSWLFSSLSSLTR